MPYITPATAAAENCVNRAKDAEALVAEGFIPDAKKKLDTAHNHYHRAKSLGCPADILAVAAAAGQKAAEVIAEAEKKAEAEREASRALAYKKARLSRAYELKGLFTREAAKYVAESLVAKGLATDIVSAVNTIIGLLPCSPLDARPDDIFEAWLILDPIPMHPLAAPLATSMAA